MQKKSEKNVAGMTEREKGIYHAEDVAQKAAAQYFGKEILSWLNIPGKVQKIAPTELVNLGVRHIYEDFNFIMENGMWYHFEFESDKVTISDLRRFREYEAATSKVYEVDVITYIICSDAGKKLLDELKTGINTYRVKVIRLKDYSAEDIFRALRENKEELISSNDLIPVALCPLLNGDSSLKERILEGFQLLKKTYPHVDTERQKCLQAILYILASKFLNEEELEKVKEGANMTRLGEMIYDDGFHDGVEQGKGLGIELGKELGKEQGKALGIELCIVTLIQSDREEGETKENIFSRLKKLFDLDEEKMESYWKKSFV